MAWLCACVLRVTRGSPTKYTPASTTYTRVPSAGSAFATDGLGASSGPDIGASVGSLTASLKQLSTYVQTMNSKLEDEREQRLRLEDKVGQLMRGNDDCSTQLGK